MQKNLSKYQQEVKNRLNKKMKEHYGDKSVWTISTVTLFLLNIIYYFVSYKIWGLETANQNGLGFLIGTILLDVILLSILPLRWKFYEIPEEIYFENKEEIESKQRKIKTLEKQISSGVVEANISLVPTPTEDEYLLKIVNKDKVKKIRDCQAEIKELFIGVNEKGRVMDFTESFTAIENPFFYWKENHSKKIDIGHSDKEFLSIAEIKDGKAIHLCELKDEYDFPVMNFSKNGQLYYEVRFKMTLTGIVGEKNQTFYKDFCGRIILTLNPTIENGKTILVDEPEFYEINESELGKYLHS